MTGAVSLRLVTSSAVKDFRAAKVVIKTREPTARDLKAMATARKRGIQSTITIHVSADLKQRIEAAARAEKKSVSEWCCISLIAAVPVDANNIPDMELPTPFKAP